MELTEKPQSGHEYAETLLAAANKEQRGKVLLPVLVKHVACCRKHMPVCGRGLTLY